MTKNSLLKKIIQSVILLLICLWIFTVEVGTVVTGSMIPNIDIGESVLYWKMFPFSKIEKGDILVYQSTDSVPIVHRVHSAQYVFIDGETVRYFQMKGDNNLSVDPTLVTPDMYVGKVFYIVKNEKINTFVKTIADINPLTRVGIALVIITCWMFITEIKSKLSSVKNKSSVEKEDNDVEQNTQKFKAGNLTIIDLDKEDKDDDTDWYNL